MRAREANALDARLPHRAKKLGKAWRAVTLTTEGVNVLAEKAHLANAVLMKPADLIDDVLEGTVALAATNVGHDAVAAEVVASRHDGDPCVPGVLAPAGKVRGKTGIVLARIGEDALLGTVERLENELGKTGDGSSAKHHVNVSHVLSDVGAVALGYAATDADDPAAMRGLGRTDHGGDLAVEVGVCLLAHAARHENHDVGLIRRGHLKAAARPKKARDALGVMKVHLAAERLNVVRESGKGRDVAH